MDYKISTPMVVVMKNGHKFILPVTHPSRLFNAIKDSCNKNPHAPNNLLALDDVVAINLNELACIHPLSGELDA